MCVCVPVSASSHLVFIHILPLTAALAQAYAPLAHDLFHAAFVSCWQALTEPFQESLVRALHTAFHSPIIPPEIIQTLLNLAEFMEHDVEALPIKLTTLAERAQKSNAYAKALHYRYARVRLMLR
jgi:serine/threonine-protein kinase mTOR